MAPSTQAEGPHGSTADKPQTLKLPIPKTSERTSLLHESPRSLTGRESARFASLESANATGKVTYWGAVSDLVTSTVGCGIVALPYAMSRAGWMGGMLLLLMSCFVSCQCTKLMGMLMAMAQQQAGPLQVVRSSEEIARYLIGKWTVPFVWVINQVDLLGTSSILLVLTARQLANLTKTDGVAQSAFGVQQLPSFVPSGTNGEAMTWWMIYLFVGLLPMSWIRCPKKLSDAAGWGFVATFVSGACILVGCARYFLNSGFQGEWTYTYTLDNIGGTAVIFIFSFSVAVLAPTLYTDMADPARDFAPAANLAHLFAGAIYVVVCFVGYLTFGNSVLDDLSLTMSEQPTCQMLITGFLTFNNFVTIPLFLHPITEQTTHQLGHWISGSDLKERVSHILIASTLLSIALGVAIAVPFFSTAQEMLGSITAMSTCIIFPNTMALGAVYKGYWKADRKQVALSVGMLALGLVIAYSGFFDAYAELVKKSAEAADETPLKIIVKTLAAKTEL